MTFVFPLYSIYFYDVCLLMDVLVRGLPFNIHGGGGLEFLLRVNYLFQPGSAARWKFHILLHVYYRTVHEVNYSFHTEFDRNYLFIKTPVPPPLPLEIEWWPPYQW